MTRIAVRVQPGARERGLVGWMADGVLKIKVSEPPEDGRANRAVAELMAAALGVRAAAVTVVRGHGSRSKVIEVEGISAEQARARVTAALAAAEGESR